MFCGLAVLFGAFGAHGLKEIVEPARVEVFNTGARYQFWHGLALLAVSLGAPGMLRADFAKWACMLWTAGIAIFSGSLYLLVLADLPWMGAITPLGGLCFIAGWATLAFAVGRKSAG